MSEGKSAGSGIDDMLRCFICYEMADQPRMCPQCSKMGCRGCLEKWVTQKQQCPFCRAHIHTGQLVNCRFMEDIYSELSRMGHAVHSKGQQAASTTQSGPEEKCEDHDLEFEYYCQDCKVPICSDCAVVSSTHKNHSFQRLQEVYLQHSTLIQQEMKDIRCRLDNLQQLEAGIEANMRLVQAGKDERKHELDLFVRNTERTWNLALKSKLLLLLSQKNEVLKESHLLESLLKELKEQLEFVPRSKLIQSSSELVLMLGSVHTKPVEEFFSDIVESNFASHVVPAYQSGDCELLLESEDVFFSPPLALYGQQWRLKVYPNGNGNSTGAFLSVFLELSVGFAGKGDVDYRIELLHPTDTSKKVTRAFRSTFERGECWGFSRFMRLDHLEEEGYVDASDGSIKLRFMVRYPEFSTCSAAQERYIQYLENINKQQALKLDSNATSQEHDLDEDEERDEEADGKDDGEERKNSSISLSLGESPIAALHDEVDIAAALDGMGSEYDISDMEDSELTMTTTPQSIHLDHDTQDDSDDNDDNDGNVDDVDDDDERVEELLDEDTGEDVVASVTHHAEHGNQIAYIRMLREKAEHMQGMLDAVRSNNDRLLQAKSVLSTALVPQIPPTTAHPTTVSTAATGVVAAPAAAAEEGDTKVDLVAQAIVNMNDGFLPLESDPEEHLELDVEETQDQQVEGANDTVEDLLAEDLRVERKAQYIAELRRQAEDMKVLMETMRSSLDAQLDLNANANDVEAEVNGELASTSDRDDTGSELDFLA